MMIKFKENKGDVYEFSLLLNIVGIVKLKRRVKIKLLVFVLIFFK